MELNEIFNYFTATCREMHKQKFKIAFVVTLLSFAILIAGMFSSSMYSSEITLYTDTQNIIKPLLGKQTEVTKIKQNRATQVRDIIYSPRQLTKVLDNIYGKDAFDSIDKKEKKLIELRKNLSITSLSGNYIKVSYSNEDADRTFRLLNEVVSLFIEDSANSKRNESRSAFDFISQQVSTYKQQLLLAENRLKTFKSTHLDGTEEEVEKRISELRTNIEDLKIQKMESISRIASLEKQLAAHDKFSNNDYEAAIYHTRVQDLQQKLSTLLLTYQDNYPEVIETRYQINDAKETLNALNSKEKSTPNKGDEFNPLYTEISSNLSNEQIEKVTINNRLNAFEELLTNAYERRKRIANNQAELTELNRDNSVTKALYEDMLANKEKARLSMVLDIEGQGVNYKIQEPATYPTVPSGPRFLHFFIAGPVVSLILMFIIFAIKILLDEKIRFSSQLQTFPNTLLLATISHMENSVEKRQRRAKNTQLFVYVLLVGSCYLTIAIMHKYNLPISQISNVMGVLK